MLARERPPRWGCVRACPFVGVELLDALLATEEELGLRSGIMESFVFDAFSKTLLLRVDCVLGWFPMVAPLLASFFLFFLPRRLLCLPLLGCSF